LAVVTRDSAEYEFDGARLQKRRRKPAATRGLNRNFNRRLKKAFKSAALDAIRTEPLKSYYQGLIQRGLRPALARLNVARKLAAVVLSLWKKGEKFDHENIAFAARRRLKLWLSSVIFCLRTANQVLS
jgi:hypothetical protein